MSLPENTELGDAMEAYLAGDTAAAFDKFIRLAEQENLIAQYCVAWMYYTGKGAEHNFEKAAEWFHRAAGYGHDFSQSMLGRCMAKAKASPKTMQSQQNGYASRQKKGL